MAIPWEFPTIASIITIYLFIFAHKTIEHFIHISPYVKANETKHFIVFYIQNITWPINILCLDK